jgi:hypothetical protein
MSQTSEQECLFWLHLRIGHKEKALDLVKPDTKFDCFDLELLSNVLEIECFDYAYLFENILPDKKFFVDLFVGALIKKYNNDEHKIRNLFVELSVRNIKLQPKGIEYPLMRTCFESCIFDSDLFEKCVGTNLTIREYSDFAKAIDINLENYDKIMCFVRYCAINLSVENVISLAEDICFELKLCSELGFLFFTKFYSDIQMELGLSLNLQEMFENGIYTERGKTYIANSPIHKFFIENGLKFSSIRAVDVLFRDVLHFIYHHNEIDLRTCLRIFENCVEDGGYDNNEHFEIVLECILILLRKNVDDDIVHILDEFKETGFDFSKCLEEHIDRDLFELYQKNFAEYVLDLFHDHQINTNVFMLMLIAGNHDDFDCWLKKSTPEVVEDLFSISSPIYSVIGNKILLYVDIYDLSVDCLLINFMYATPEDSPRLIDKIIEKIHDYEFNLDFYLDCICINACSNIKFFEENLDIWWKLIEVISTEEYFDVLIYLIHQCGASRSNPKVSRILLALFLDKIESINHDFSSKGKDIYDFIKNFEWYQGGIRTGKDDSHLPHNPSKLIRRLVKFCAAEILHEYPDLNSKEEPIKSTNPPTNNTSDLNTIVPLELSKLQYKTIIDNLMQFRNLIVSKGIFNADQMQKFIDYLMSAKNTIIESFSNKVFDYDTHVHQFLFAHSILVSTLIKEILQEYADAGLSFQNLHLKVHLVDKYPWHRNKYIVEFVLEQNGFL